MFAFATPRRHRHPSLTPMIDVVFLLLVFFMLASRFGQDRALPIATATAASTYSGPPRLITITPGAVTLNGTALALAALTPALRRLIRSRDDIIVLQPRGGASVQRLTDVAEALRAAGFARLVLVE